MMQVLAVISLSWVLTNGLWNARCGVQIRASYKRGDGTTGMCYLNVGHVSAANIHGLDDANEWNAMWQCSGYTSGRIWFYEGGVPNTRLFTIAPDRNNRYGEYFLSRDAHYSQGIDVNYAEYNAKVDKQSGQKVAYIKTGDTETGFANLMVRLSDNRPLLLQRGSVTRMYKLVTGQIVKGFEAKWEGMGDDVNQKKDNAIQLMRYPCGSNIVRRAGDVDPILDYPILDPISNNPNFNPASVIIEIPGGVSQYVAVLCVLAVVVLICGFYTICSWYKGKSKKAIYKAVKYDSETDAV